MSLKQVLFNMSYSQESGLQPKCLSTSFNVITSREWAFAVMCPKCLCNNLAIATLHPVVDIGYHCSCKQDWQPNLCGKTEFCENMAHYTTF